MTATLVAIAALGMVATAAALPPHMPAADIMSRGFDMVKGTQNGSTPEKPLLPVFEFSYTGGQVWFDPSDSSIQFSVPDELSLVNVDHSFEVINSAMVTSYQQWLNIKMHSYSVGVGVSMGEGTKAMSLNAKYSQESFQYKMRSERDTQSSGFSKHEWALFQLTAFPPEFCDCLHPMFKKITSMLPKSISSADDQKKYNQVVQYYGTHYANEAQFGGRAHVSTFLNNSYIKTKTQQWLKQQFSLTFHYDMFDISAGGYTNRSDIHVSSDFKQHAHTAVFFEGGDVTLQSNATVVPWTRSIPNNPHQLNTTLNDISTLITDTDIAANLQKTIKVYIDEGRMPPTDGSVKDYDAYYANVELPAPKQKRALRG